MLTITAESNGLLRLILSMLFDHQENASHGIPVGLCHQALREGSGTVHSTVSCLAASILPAEHLSVRKTLITSLPIY
jgi:hypothetical protein